MNIVTWPKQPKHDVHVHRHVLLHVHVRVHECYKETQGLYNYSQT